MIKILEDCLKYHEKKADHFQAESERLYCMKKMTTNVVRELCLTKAGKHQSWAQAIRAALVQVKQEEK